MTALMTVLREFCCGCGVCLSICPNRAISPVVRNGIISISNRDENCTDCKLCIEVCPALNYAYSQAIEPTYEETVGKSFKTFICHATDDRVRRNGASGGAITALLLQLLEENCIDGALVTRMKAGATKSYVARTKEEVLASQGSTYFSTFGLQHLRELTNAPGCNAIVGLPCQIDALKLAKEQFPTLMDKIYASFGLICFHVNEPWYLDYIVRRVYKIEPSGVVAITSRSGDWPGAISIKSVNRHERISYSRFWYPLPLFHFTSPIGCLYCANHLNVNADIAFGDAWFQESVKTDGLGSSIAIARTKKGLSLLEKGKISGSIYLKEISIEDALRGQSLRQRTVETSLRRASLRRRLFGSTDFQFLKVVDALLPVCHASSMRNKIARGIMYGLPLNLLRTYCRLCGFIQKIGFA